MFKTFWHPKTKEDLKVLDPEIRKRIILKIRSIASDPLHFADRLEGYNLFKLRIGDYRALFEIDASQNFIMIVLIGHRSRVCKQLRNRI
jgi:mRNA-degrading endonuclease RelE of RelBE toxin-antitoxin system